MVTAVDTLAAALAGQPAIVLCLRKDDAEEWERSFAHTTAIVLRDRLIPAQHPLDQRDPRRLAAVLAIDPLTVPNDERSSLGVRNPVWQLFEDKTVIDCLWDRLGVPRPASVVGDHTLDLIAASRAVNRGDGVVCAVQTAGAEASANASGISWWSDGRPDLYLPRGSRVKIPPLLIGRAMRLHGLITDDLIAPFPTMNVVTLPRFPLHQFLCCGCVPAPLEMWAVDLTRQLGSGLRDLLGYRGVFSVDGILADRRFLPTDLNTRITSAIEAAPTDIRIRLQAANICAREHLRIDPAEIDDLCAAAFNTATTTIYGASATLGRTRAITIYDTPNGVSDQPDGPAIGNLSAARSIRGWTVSATLQSRYDPCRLAPTIWALSDRILGTDFGELGQPFDGSPAGDRRAQPSD